MSENNPGTPNSSPSNPEPPAPVDPWSGMTGSWTHPAPTQWTPPTPYNYGVPAYGQLPPSYYAAPDDPLVSSDFGGWWTKSFRLLRKAWRPIAILQLISAIPQIVFLVELENRTNGLVNELNTNSTITSFGTLFDPYTSLAFPFLIAILVSMTTSLASLRILVQQATGEPLSIARALTAALRRLPALIGWGIPATLMVLVGLVFCILPGLYLMIVFAVLSTVVMLERGNAIGRVFALFHADFGASLARVLVTGAVAFGLNSAAGIITNPITAMAGPSTATSIVTQTISGLVAIIGATLTVAMLLTAYADMRARHEPFSTAYLRPQSF